MITNPNDYYGLLYQIQDKNFPLKYPALPSPEDESLVQVDLNSRTIDNKNNYITVEGDHAAEIIYFEVNRYFDTIDLTNMMCIIQYINADNEKRIYPVPYYDVITHKDKIIFPWVLNYSATKKSGEINYMITFYKIEKNTNNLLYNLNTLPSKIQVYSKLNLDSIVKEDDYYVIDDSQVVQQIWERLARLEGFVGENGMDVYWLILK